MMPWPLYWPRGGANKAHFGQLGGLITGLLSSSTKGNALALLLLLMPSLIEALDLRGPPRRKHTGLSPC